MSKHYVEMPEEVLAQAVGYAHQGDLLNMYRTVWKAFGIDITDPDIPTFKAWDYELPMAQWVAISGGLQVGSQQVNRTRDPIRQVNLMLDWMNAGPSARDSRDEQ